MQLPIKPLYPDVTLPTYATDGAAGMDLRAYLPAPITLKPNERVLIPTGFAIALPAGTVGLLCARSSLGVRHGITLPNTVGVIDADYRGEIQVALVNWGEADYDIAPGDRIAQLLVVPYLKLDLVPTNQLPETSRGSGGFGSTGK